MNNLFTHSTLFHGLSEKQIQEIISLGEEVFFSAGENIVEQGEVADNFYLLCDGKVEVLMKKESGSLHQVAILHEGNTIGEMSIIDQGYRSATVRAIEKVRLLKIQGEDFRKIAEKSVLGCLTYRNLAVDLGKRLRKTNDVTVVALEKALEQTKKQVVVGNFMVSVLVVLTLFTFSLGIMTHLTHIFGTSGYVTVCLLFITTFIMVHLMVQSGYDLDFYGLTVKDWRKAALEGIIWSLPVILIATIVKGILISWVPEFHSEPLFNIKGAIYHSKADGSDVFLLTVLYVFVSTPLQEFLFRGCFQGTLRSFLIGPHVKIVSVITTSLVFAMVHLMISPVLALLSFMGGIFWGVLYNRQKTLVGVIVSHILIGAWLFFALGIEHLMVGKIG